MDQVKPIWRLYFEYLRLAGAVFGAAFVVLAIADYGSLGRKAIVPITVVLASVAGAYMSIAALKKLSWQESVVDSPGVERRHTTRRRRDAALYVVATTLAAVFVATLVIATRVTGERNALRHQVDILSAQMVESQRRTEALTDHVSRNSDAISHHSATLVEGRWPNSQTAGSFVVTLRTCRRDANGVICQFVFVTTEPKRTLKLLSADVVSSLRDDAGTTVLKATSMKIVASTAAELETQVEAAAGVPVRAAVEFSPLSHRVDELDLVRLSFISGAQRFDLEFRAIDIAS